MILLRQRHAEAPSDQKPLCMKLFYAVLQHAQLQQLQSTLKKSTVQAEVHVTAS